MFSPVFGYLERVLGGLYTLFPLFFVL